MNMLASVSVIVAMAIINAARGGRYETISALPGHTRLWASLGVLFVSLIWTMSPMSALTWGACYLFWSILPWGRWFDLNNSATLPDRKPSWFEIAVEKISKDNDAVAFTIRNFVAFIPAMVFISPLMVFLVAAQLASYWIGWSLAPKREIELSEYLMGAAWGAALILI